MNDPYSVSRDGVFSRPYEPGLLGLPREQQQRLGRLSGEGGAAGRVRIKQELDLVPERVKMEPEESLEYYYAAATAAGRAMTLDSFASRPRQLATASPLPLSPSGRECMAYSPPPPVDGFAAYAVATFRETEAGVEQPPTQQRFHRVNLTMHLKEEAREEAEREGGARGEGGRGQSCPPPAQDEEDEYRERSETGSSRTVIGGCYCGGWRSDSKR